MKVLYSEEEFNKARSIDLLPVVCNTCNKKLYKEKREIIRIIKRNGNVYCSKECVSIGRTKSILATCIQCGNQFKKQYHRVKTRPNHFCSHTCSATYNNQHKTHGIRRSKLEEYLETDLTKLYPDLDIHFNRKDAIGSELDIYIPSLNIAFELNGIFHYEPIFGVDKLKKISKNDLNKSKACIDAKIDLCIIDTSYQKRFTISSSQKFLTIIVDIINSRMQI
jgi:hypothetical protein